MTSEQSGAATPFPLPQEGNGDYSLQVHFKTERDCLTLFIPPPSATALDWLELWQQLQQRLDAGKRFWNTSTPVNVVVGDRLIDGRQLQQLTTALSAVNLQLQCLHTNRRQTAVAAVTAGYSVEQQSPILPLSQSPLSRFRKTPSEPSVVEPLYLQTTLRSGNEVRHPGTVVILGDLNPGSAVIADGDILVWGRLRGIAHAGAGGNRQCRIMALQMEPTQLRVAELVARAPENPPTYFYPEVAYIEEDRIQITRTSDSPKK
ncbi:MAG: septum site-determining protein MinC [Cyanobacteria bacterium P01_A01_bin.17]